jgi:hypothetical protein
LGKEFFFKPDTVSIFAIQMNFFNTLPSRAIPLRMFSSLAPPG